MHKSDTQFRSNYQNCPPGQDNPVRCFSEHQDGEKQLLRCQEKIGMSISVIPVWDSSMGCGPAPCSTATYSVQTRHWY